MKIDVFSHVMPRKYEQAMNQRVQSNKIVDAVGTKRSIGDFQKALWDMDFRFKIMDKYEGLVQVLTPTNLPLELIANPTDAAYLARIYNDEMAELVSKYPTRFITAAACLPLNNIEASLKEIDRAINELGFKGIFMHTPIHYQSTEDRRALDQAELIPIYEKMVSYNLPIWIHPRRENTVPDYTNESRSLYAINHVFGWPFETSVAMTRLVFSGIMERFPGLKFLTHHCGAMIPYFADRIAGQYDYFDAAAGAGFKKNLTRPPLDYFRMFYNDTALYGNTPALMCAYQFFGADRILFGTDFPFDVEFGDKFTRDTINAIEGMAITEAEKSKIFESNARALLCLD
jgi:predicted TIM-barrel fold metal-dependent hydrolase